MNKYEFIKSPFGLVMKKHGDRIAQIVDYFLANYQTKRGMELMELIRVGVISSVKLSEIAKIMGGK